MCHRQIFFVDINNHNRARVTESVRLPWPRKLLTDWLPMTECSCSCSWWLGGGGQLVVLHAAAVWRLVTTWRCDAAAVTRLAWQQDIGRVFSSSRAPHKPAAGHWPWCSNSWHWATWHDRPVWSYVELTRARVTQPIPLTHGCPVDI